MDRDFLAEAAMMLETKHCLGVAPFLVYTVSVFSLVKRKHLYPSHIVAVTVQLKFVCENVAPLMHVGYLLLGSDLCL